MSSAACSRVATPLRIGGWLLCLLATASSSARAEISLELELDGNTNTYGWSFLEFGSTVVNMVQTPGGGTFDSNFNGGLDFATLVSEVTGDWTIQTSAGEISFSLEAPSASDFVMPVLSSPTPGQAFLSGEAFPLVVSAPGNVSVGRGFFSPGDGVSAEFVSDPFQGFRVTLDPGVTSTEFRVFGLTQNLFSVTEISDPNNLFEQEASYTAFSPTVSVTVTAIPEPSALLAGLAIAGVLIARRRTRTWFRCR